MEFNARQISGINIKQECILGVFVKQTYTIAPNGNCTLADVQLPLIDNPVEYPHNKQLLASDTDFFLQKKYCDVVVKGKARNYSKSRQFAAQIIIGDSKFSIAVQGNQKAYLDSYGKIQFADIETIEEVPLQYDFAYGGKDLEAEKKIELPAAELLTSMPDLDLLANSPYRYQRNTEGKGYIVELTKNAVEQLEIPNLQDPEALLTPENIIVGNIDRWVEMPIPYATDWVNHVWFPRFAYTGMGDYPKVKTSALKEIKMNWVEPDIFEPKELGKGINSRFSNGGHYALQIDLHNNVKECKLINIHPTEKNFTIKLPLNKPQIWVDGRKGKLLQTKPVMNTILIEPDEQRLSIIWCGTAPAIRNYFGEELKTMPYKVEW